LVLEMKFLFSRKNLKNILYEFINQPKTVELLTKEKYYIDLYQSFQ
jgi:hypothetical protein